MAFSDFWKKYTKSISRSPLGAGLRFPSKVTPFLERLVGSSIKERQDYTKLASEDVLNRLRGGRGLSGSKQRELADLSTHTAFAAGLSGPAKKLPGLLKGSKFLQKPATTLPPSLSKIIPGAPKATPKPGFRPLSQSYITSLSPKEALGAFIKERPVRQVTAAIKRLKPLRAQQELLYSKTRGKRIARGGAVGKKVGGEKGFYAKKAQLEGTMEKVQYESIRKQVGQENIDALFNRIENSTALDSFDKVTAGEGLKNLFGGQGAKLPTNKQLELLEKELGGEFVTTVLKNRPALQKIADAGYQLANIPRSLMSSFDLSAPFRQGIFLVGRPKQFFGAFKPMFKSFGSEKYFQASQEGILARKTYPLMKKAELAITDLNVGPLAREEKFMSSWAEKIPGIGNIVRRSGRAYTTYLNKLRADVFDDVIKKAHKTGANIESPKLLDDLGKFINAASGRGGLGALEKAAVPLNTVLFSPRLMTSRLKLLNPTYYTNPKLSPIVRKEALKSLFSFAGISLTTLGLAKLAGADVGADPRSADFGKIKFGDTRYDILGGFQQYIKLAAQLYTGEIVSSTTGKEMKLEGGFGNLSRLDIATRFGEYKESPIASFASELLRSETVLGEEPKYKELNPFESDIGKRFTSMVLQDMYDLIKERGIEGLPMSLPAIFGVGSQTYGKKQKSYLESVGGTRDDTFESLESRLKK